MKGIANILVTGEFLVNTTNICVWCVMIAWSQLIYLSLWKVKLGRIRVIISLTYFSPIFLWLWFVFLLPLLAPPFFLLRIHRSFPISINPPSFSLFTSPSLVWSLATPGWSTLSPTTTMIKCRSYSFFVPFFLYFYYLILLGFWVLLLIFQVKE